MTSTVVSVSVCVDPATAFTAFTEELDLWWVRGPINYFDAARAVGMRCEPGIGGRLLEVYDEATGEGRELGRITVWEPGGRLAWKSSVDDVEIDVRFLPAAAGTDVMVEATIPDGGADRGGTAWFRVVPKWFGPWCARRDTAPRPQRELARLAGRGGPLAGLRLRAGVAGSAPGRARPAARGELRAPLDRVPGGELLADGVQARGRRSGAGAADPRDVGVRGRPQRASVQGRGRRGDDRSRHQPDRVPRVHGAGPRGEPVDLRPGPAPAALIAAPAPAIVRAARAPLREPARAER